MERDAEAIDLMLAQLGDLWKGQPDLRLGQLIVNAVQPSVPCPEIYSIEDEQLLRRTDRYLRRVGSDRTKPAS